MKAVLITAAVSLTMVLLFLTLGIPYAENNFNYSGKEVFNTEQEYSLFKQEVVKAGANWERMEVLASEPPIIVKYKIRTTKESPFPYGEATSVFPIWAQLLLLVAVTTFVWTNPWLSFSPFKD